MAKRTTGLLCALALFGCAQGFPFVQPAAPGAPLQEHEISAGLREALRIGTGRAANRIGRMDGFWKNPELRIPLPDQLQSAEKVLRAVGREGMVDEFHLSLNRAAERAVPEAVPIFSDAIQSMTLADARGILEGGTDAATTWFRDRTAASLSANLKPVVSTATDAAGATRAYKDLVNKAGRVLSGSDLAALDLDAYITRHALDGLFRTLAAEEKRIREDPGARTGALLQRVFGSGK